MSRDNVATLFCRVSYRQALFYIQDNSHYTQIVIIQMYAGKVTNVLFKSHRTGLHPTKYTSLKDGLVRVAQLVVPRLVVREIPVQTLSSRVAAVMEFI